MIVFPTILAIFFFASFDQVKVIDLDQLDAKFADRTQSLSMADDGSFLLKEYTRIIHWEPSGKMKAIIRFKVGDGQPVYIADVHYDLENQRYWITEAVSGSISIYDQHGELLGKTNDRKNRVADEITYVRYFVEAKDRVLGVAWQDIDLWAEPDPSVLVELNLEETKDGSSWRMSSASAPFFKLNETQKMFGFNWKQHFAVLQGNRLFVANELSPILYKFKAKQRGNNRVYEAAPVNLTMALPKYRAPNRRGTEKAKNNAENLAWWYSWSRVNGLYAWGKNFLVGYEIPDPNDPQSFLQAVQVIDQGGNPAGPYMELKGQLAGVHNGEVFFLTKNADDLYQVEVFKPSL